MTEATPVKTPLQEQFDRENEALAKSMFDLGWAHMNVKQKRIDLQAAETRFHNLEINCSKGNEELIKLQQKVFEENKSKIQLAPQAAPEVEPAPTPEATA